MHESAVTQRGQKMVSDPQKLELRGVVTYSIWVLGTKLGSPARAVCTPDLWAVSLAPTNKDFVGDFHVFPCHIPYPLPLLFVLG